MNVKFKVCVGSEKDSSFDNRHTERQKLPLPKWLVKTIQKRIGEVIEKEAGGSRHPEIRVSVWGEDGIGGWQPITKLILDTSSATRTWSDRASGFFAELAGQMQPEAGAK